MFIWGPPLLYKNGKFTIKSVDKAKQAKWLAALTFSLCRRLAIELKFLKCLIPQASL